MRDLPVVILVVVMFSLGCGLFERFRQTETNSNAASGNTASSTAPEAGTVPVSGDPRADVVAASKKFLELPQFSARMEGRGTTNMSVKLDYQAPDRYHMVNLSGQPGMSEFIIIGKDMYMKAGDRWQKMPGAVGNSMPNIRQLFNEEGLKSLQDVEYVRDDTLDGQPTHVYTYRNAKGGDVPFPFRSTIWVSAVDGLPRKIDVTYEEGELKTMTIDYDYNTNVDIKPPVK